MNRIYSDETGRMLPETGAYDETTPVGSAIREITKVFVDLLKAGYTPTDAERLIVRTACQTATDVATYGVTVGK